MKKSQQDRCQFGSHWIWLSVLMSASASASVPALPSLVFEEILVTEDEPLLADEEEVLSAISTQAVEQKLARLTAQDEASQPIFATFSDLDNTQDAANTVARIETQTAPIGLPDPSVLLPSDKPSNPQDDTIIQEGGGSNAQENALNPEDYLPDYQQSETAPTQESNTSATAKSPNLLRRAYNRLFNDGVASLPKLKANVYLAVQEEQAVAPEVAVNADETQAQSEWVYEKDYVAYLDNREQKTRLVKADNKQEPFKNIKAALDNITQESALNFSVALPRLREVVATAAQAVGYYDVDFFLKDGGSGKVDVIIYDLGEPVLVASQLIDIRGEGANLPAITDIKDKAIPKVGQVFHHGQYQSTKATIDALPVEQGFFDGRWLNHSVDVLLPDNTADISLVYDTGSQYVFDEVVFFTIDPATGQMTDDPNKLPLKLPLLQQLVAFEAGQPFARSQVNRLSNDLLSTRYFNTASVEPILPNTTDESAVEEVSTPSEEASSVLALDDETVAMISPIDFSPSQAMLDKLTLVTDKAERLYNSPDDRVLETQDKKRNTSLLGRLSDGISSIVKAITPDESKDTLSLPEGAPPELANKKTPAQVRADKKVPLYVFVMADKPKDAQLGVGWGSDSGARLTTRFENHLINRSGYQAGMQLELSQSTQGATLFASRPYKHPTNDRVGANLKYVKEDIDQGSGNFQLSASTLEQGLYRKIVKENNWSRTYSLRYRLDELETNAPRDTWKDLPIHFEAGAPTQEALLLGMSMNKSVLNNLSAPTQGYRQSYSLELGSKSVVSEADMAIARIGLGGVYSFGNNVYGDKRAHQLIGRLDLGYLWTNNFDDVPYKLRFFAGGDQSIRGYAYESLSPLSSSGYLTGGQILAVGSAEYNYEVREGLRAAVFADVGNAYDTGFTNDTKLGVGVGVRWASPVGTVRVDVAKGVGDDVEETPLRLHFLIGLPF